MMTAVILSCVFSLGLRHVSHMHSATIVGNVFYSTFTNFFY